MVLRSLWTLGALAVLSSSVSAAPLISEIYFNPPGGNDAPSTNALEYIELCAPLGTSLDDTFLIFVENENDQFDGQDPGVIENIFNLNGMTIGANGYLVLAQRNSAYPDLVNTPFDVAVPVNAANPTKAESLKTLANGAHVYQNRDTGNGYGNGATSSIGHVGENLDIEGSGFTAFLIKVDTTLGANPVLGFDLDEGNNGLDALPTGWSILDGIGVFGEPDETAYGRLYASVNFGPGPSLGLPGGFEPGATYINTSTGLGEIEYVSRVGVGTDASNWMVANLTADPLSGFVAAARNYAISGTHATQTNPEVYVGSSLGPAPFVYGTDITVTFGADNVGFSGQHIPEASSVVLSGIAAAGFVIAAVGRRRSAKA